MKVSMLLIEVENEVLDKKRAKAKCILKQKTRELDRAKSIVSKLEYDLEEFLAMDLADIELCDYRY